MAKTAEVSNRHEAFSLFLNTYFPNEENCTEQSKWNKNIAITLISLSFLVELPLYAFFIKKKKSIDISVLLLSFFFKNRQTLKGLNQRHIITLLFKKHYKE